MNGLTFLDSETKMPAMKLPVRSVVVTLKEARVLISPGSKLSEAQLRSLESVSDLVAPSLLHCGGMVHAAAVFPEAKVWGPARAREIKPEIKWNEEISETNWPYQTELACIQLQGMPRNNEVVFFHRQSKTVIICDLAFNLKNAEGFGAWLILHLMGTYRKFAMSRLFNKFILDRQAFEKSIAKIFEWDFDNIVVSHGNEIKGEAKQKLRAALAARNIKA